MTNVSSPSFFKSIFGPCSHAFRIKPIWDVRKCGIQLGAGRALQNLRFADDLLVIGKSSQEVEFMLKSLVVEAARAGLHLHPGKTKILSNCQKRRGLLVAWLMDLASLWWLVLG